MFFFFFSSRRRHTRSKRDWSSDVCSSDLVKYTVQRICAAVSRTVEDRGTAAQILWTVYLTQAAALLELIWRRRVALPLRSEERRVGKECRSRWGACR